MPPPMWVKTDLQKYGPLLDKVRYLRKNGWVIFMEGETGMFRVGTKLLNADGLVDIWKRERARDESLTHVAPKQRRATKVG